MHTCCRAAHHCNLGSQRVQQLLAPLFDINELVDANIVHSVDQQQHYYHYKTPSKLREEQKVLLDNPTKGKLDHCRTGPWVVLHCNVPTSVRLKMGTGRQTFHIDFVHLLLEEDKNADVSAHWESTPFQY